MTKISIKTQNGESAGEFELSPSVFEADQNAVLVREVYNAYMQNQRQGTHQTKTRGMVSGGGIKPWKQKGTGRARQGSIRAPQWRHGAIIFGPQPRDYREKINKKKKAGAYKALLSSKLSKGEIVVVDSIDFGAESKTRSVLDFLAKVGATGKTLIVTKDKNESLVRAARNLESSTQNPTRTAVAGAINIFDLLVCNTLVITRDALETIQERLA